MADMDQISVTIGKLTAQAEASTNQRKALFNKVDGIEESVANLTVVVEKSIVNTNDMLKVHADKLSGHGKSIVGLTKFRNRMYIGMAGIGGTGGIVTYIKTKFGM